MSKGIGGFVMVGLVVLAVVYVYNSFIAEKGKSVADLGKKATV